MTQAFGEWCFSSVMVSFTKHKFTLILSVYLLLENACEVQHGIQMFNWSALRRHLCLAHRLVPSVAHVFKVCATRL